MLFSLTLAIDTWGKKRVENLTYKRSVEKGEGMREKILYRNATIALLAFSVDCKKSFLRV